MFGHPHGGRERHDPRGMGHGWGHGRGGHDRHFGPWHGQHPGFDMPGPHPPEVWERVDFDYHDDEGEYAMFGHGRGGRGGRPHGRPGAEFGLGFGRGAGRPERPLEQGDLRWLVLDLIAEQPRHGYEIIKAIEDLMNGHYTPSPGVIYPTLTYLEETGLIASETQGSKKRYSITDEGRASLEANATAVQAIRARIAEARSRFGAPPAPELMRAMDNLRAALQVRLTKGVLTPESLAMITAALDRAAGEIERS